VVAVRFFCDGQLAAGADMRVELVFRLSGLCDLSDNIRLRFPTLVSLFRAQDSTLRK
jgi:hypothetical protein